MVPRFGSDWVRFWHLRSGGAAIWWRVGVNLAHDIEDCDNQQYMNFMDAYGLADILSIGPTIWESGDRIGLAARRWAAHGQWVVRRFGGDWLQLRHLRLGVDLALTR